MYAFPRWIYRAHIIRSVIYIWVKTKCEEQQKKRMRRRNFAMQIICAGEDGKFLNFILLGFGRRCYFDNLNNSNDKLFSFEIKTGNFSSNLVAVICCCCCFCCRLILIMNCAWNCRIKKCRSEFDFDTHTNRKPNRNKWCTDIRKQEDSLCFLHFSLILCFSSRAFPQDTWISWNIWWPTMPKSI